MTTVKNIHICSLQTSCLHSKVPLCASIPNDVKITHRHETFLNRYRKCSNSIELYVRVYELKLTSKPKIYSHNKSLWDRFDVGQKF